jgi:hypothetical protein
MSDEELRVRALQHDDLHGRVGFDLPPDAVEVFEHRHVHEVEFAVVDRNRCDRLLHGDLEGRMAPVLHGLPSRGVWLACPADPGRFASTAVCR